MGQGGRRWREAVRSVDVDSCSGPGAKSCWDPGDMENPWVPPAWSRGSQQPDLLGGETNRAFVGTTKGHPSRVTIQNHPPG